MQRLYRLFAVMVVLIAIAGCQQSGSTPGTVTSADDSPGNLTPINNGDAEVNRAIAKARATSLDFTKALASNAGDTDSFFVCKRFYGAGGSVEDLWLSNVGYDGHHITGIIDNNPYYVKSVHLGDSASVAPGDIIDWKYNNHGKMVGGFTIRAYYYEASPADKQEMLQNSGLTPNDMVRNY